MRFELSCKQFGIWWQVWEHSPETGLVTIALLRLAWG